MRSQIAQLKRRFAPNLVHINLFGPSALFHYDTASVDRAPVLLTLHNQESAMLQRSCAADGLFRTALRDAQWVACVSAAVLSHWRQTAPEISSYSSILYNGFAAPTSPLEPLPFDSPLVLCLGRLSPEKGFDLAVAAFAAVAARFPEARLVIAGDGPERAALERQAARLNLHHAVEWRGWIAPEDVTQLLRTTTMVLLPSRHEGLPSVAVEAALMGRPVIGTRVGGIPEIILDGETGLLIPPEQPDSLAQAIQLLLNDPQRAAALGNAARNRAQNIFSFDHYLASYDALYTNLI
jgi:glycogen(starch) synthase